MSEPTDFRFDIRVRERMTRSGRLGEDELDAHLAGLADLDANAQAVDVKQPALGGREEPRDVLPPPFGTASLDDLPPPPPPQPMLEPEPPPPVHPVDIEPVPARAEEVPSFDAPTRPIDFTREPVSEPSDGEVATPAVDDLDDWGGGSS